MLLNLTTIIFIIIIFFYLINLLKLNRNKKAFKAKKFLTFNKKNLNHWMNLTKKERYNLSKKESITYLDKRKLLLEEIRKEYKKISTRTSEKN
jgi:hypothetical protein